MLVAAALVPPTALLVPGVSGREDLLAAERRRARDVVAVLLRGRPEVVLVLVPDAGVEAQGSGLGWSLRATGVPDALLGAAGLAPDGAGLADVPSAVALWLLADAGWTGPVEVRGAGTDGAALADLVSGPQRVAALAVGGGSVRRGPDAPLEDDPTAAEVDGELVDWLGNLGDPGAVLALDPTAVAHHHLDAVGPARALAAALPGSGLVCTGVADSAPLGATYLVAGWASPGGAP